MSRKNEAHTDSSCRLLNKDASQLTDHSPLLRATLERVALQQLNIQNGQSVFILVVKTVTSGRRYQKEIFQRGR